jgi:4-carboxymuconolactone decarboxylase
MSESAVEDTPVLDLLASMTADSVQASSLDEQSVMLVRLAALVASSAPAASYALNLAAAGEVGLDADDVRGVLTAIAPIVGTSRVVGATGRIVVALGVAIEVAAAEQDDDLDA